MDTPDLAALERRTYRAAFDHGLIDILLGTYLAVTGLMMSLELFKYSGVAGGVMAGMGYPLWRVLRQKLVEPRLGYVKLNPERRRKLRWGPIAAVAVMACVIGLGFWVAGNRAEFAVFPGFIPGLVFAAPIAACGYFLDLRRMYIYGAVILLERVLDAAWGKPYEFMYWPSGLVIAATGAVVLNQFLTRYPLPMRANADA